MAKMQLSSSMAKALGFARGTKEQRLWEWSDSRWIARPPTAENKRRFSPADMVVRSKTVQALIDRGVFEYVDDERHGALRCVKIVSVH